MPFSKRSVAALALLAVLALPVLDATAHDESKYPDWSGQWRRPRGLATQWDQDKPAGVAQQAPLKPEYQKMLESSIADQAAGGQGLDTRYTCITNGMPRMMAVIQPTPSSTRTTSTGSSASSSRSTWSPRAVISRRMRSRASPAIRSANGRTPMAMAASIRSRSRPATSRVRGRWNSPASRCTRTIRPS